MIGKITGISGPTVRVDAKGLTLYQRVYVGNALLTGEVVRIEEKQSMVQVYEDTRGIAIGEPVKGTGMPLTVRLGPGLLSGMFDGLQRPLLRLREDTGSFMKPVKEEMTPLDHAKKWIFHPLKRKGDKITSGEIIGYVEEGHIKHLIPCTDKTGGELLWVADGEFCLDEPLGELDGGRELFGYHEWPVRVPKPYKKKFPPTQPLITGQRSIDFLFTVTKGGTAILPGGFGTGKTILEQSIAKFADVDIVVYVGCGERGNEMAELIEELHTLKDPWANRGLMERTILGVNTSNMPVAAREASIYTAATMAEYYRDMGYHVLLIADSISRWAEALREISSSLEEMPGEEGYPTYLASRLSGFLERAGVVETISGSIGSLSIILSVSPPGGDFTEPVTQSCLRITGTFLMLDTSLAHRRHFPAINWFQSYSLYGKELAQYYKEKVSHEWEDTQLKCREILQKEEELREVAEIVGLEGLQDADRLLMHVAERIRLEFLCQNAYTDDAFSSPEQTLSKIKQLLVFYETSSEKLKQGGALDTLLTQKRGTS
ncbi:MAG: V-type ATP synthase subunit A [Thermodesulfovibrionia bacterium]|nr:V-type ATP synthase subunit A [Thermodesulfovibrionia bacterium]